MAKSATVKGKFKSADGKNLTITCELLGADESWDHYATILDIIAPFAGGMMDESSKDEMMDMYHKPTFWKDALSAITKQLRTPEVKDMVQALLSTCQCQGEVCDMSWEEFRGNMSLLTEVLMWVIKEHFGDALDVGKLGLSQLIS